MLVFSLRLVVRKFFFVINVNVIQDNMLKKI